MKAAAVPHIERLETEMRSVAVQRSDETVVLEQETQRIAQEILRFTNQLIFVRDGFGKIGGQFNSQQVRISEEPNGQSLYIRLEQHFDMHPGDMNAWSTPSETFSHWAFVGSVGVLRDQAGLSDIEEKSQQHGYQGLKVLGRDLAERPVVGQVIFTERFHTAEDAMSVLNTAKLVNESLHNPNLNPRAGRNERQQLPQLGVV